MTEAYIGNITAAPLLRNPSENGGPVIIPLENGRKALLDQQHAYAETWIKQIVRLHKEQRPVYLDILSANGHITAIGIPEATLVWQVEETETGARIAFHTSSAYHFLYREQPHFHRMLEQLRAAMEAGTPLLVTARPLSSVIVDVRELPLHMRTKQLLKAEPEPYVPGRAVSPERAKHLFGKMLERNCDPLAISSACIPFNFPANGCWIRAHLMCYMLVREKEQPGKIWSSGALKAHTVNDPSCLVSWPWHVAPVLMVTQPDGSAAEMVLDPSLCTEPVMPGVWLALQTDPKANYIYSSWKRYGHYGGEAEEETASEDMNICRYGLRDMCEESGPPPYRQSITGNP